MALVNVSNREVNIKIVYYGPALSGKKTNLRYIHKKLNPKQRGEIINLPIGSDTVLFFDFLPLSLSNIKGFKTRFHVCAVSGEIHHESTEKMLLKSVDGIVFVADSRQQRLNDNAESLRNLEKHLREYNKFLGSLPFVIQYNRRDEKDAATIDELRRTLNGFDLPEAESVSLTGQGILETFADISKQVVQYLKEKPTLLNEDRAEEDELFARLTKATAKTVAGDREEMEIQVSRIDEFSESARESVNRSAADSLIEEDAGAHSSFDTPEKNSTDSNASSVTAEISEAGFSKEEATDKEFGIEKKKTAFSAEYPEVSEHRSVSEFHDDASSAEKETNAPFEDTPSEWESLKYDMGQSAPDLEVAGENVVELSDILEEEYSGEDLPKETEAEKPLFDMDEMMSEGDDLFSRHEETDSTVSEAAEADSYHGDWEEESGGIPEAADANGEWGGRENETPESGKEMVEGTEEDHPLFDAEEIELEGELFCGEEENPVELLKERETDLPEVPASEIGADELSLDSLATEIRLPERSDFSENLSETVDDEEAELEVTMKLSASESANEGITLEEKTADYADMETVSLGRAQTTDEGGIAIPILINTGAGKREYMLRLKIELERPARPEFELSVLHTKEDETEGNETSDEETENTDERGFFKKLFRKKESSRH